MLQSKSGKFDCCPLTLRNSPLQTYMGGLFIGDRLMCCDWTSHKFIEVNFSKLADSQKKFRLNFVSIHYDLRKILREILK